MEHGENRTERQGRNRLRPVICVALSLAAVVGAFFAGRATAEPTYTLGKTFYAVIEEIYEGTDGYTIVKVKGLEINDVNHRNYYTGAINEETELTWRHTELEIGDLKAGQTVAVTYTGGKLMSAPARLEKIRQIELLDDAK